MTTAHESIKRALRQIQVLDPDEEPTASEAQDALTALNDMLDSWSTQKAYIYATRVDPFAWPALAQSVTVGPGGDVDIARPTKIAESTFYTNVHGDDYNVTFITTRRGYTSILDKETGTDLPRYLYWEPTYPLGILYVWPVPNPAITMNLISWQALAEPATLATELSFPPGYREAFASNLAVNIASEFGVAAPPEITRLAATSRRRIRGLNRKVPIAQVETGFLTDRKSFNIYSGE